MSLFGGLNVKRSGGSEIPPSKQEVSSANGPVNESVASGFGFVESSSQEYQNDESQAQSSGFGFLTTQETDDQPSGFSFLQPVADEAPSEFSFLSGGINEDHELENHNEGDEDAHHTVYSSSAPPSKYIDHLAPAPVVRPANVKKKRSRVKPGFERKSGSDANLATYENHQGKEDSHHDQNHSSDHAEGYHDTEDNTTQEAHNASEVHHHQNNLAAPAIHENDVDDDVHEEPEHVTEDEVRELSAAAKSSNYTDTSYDEPETQHGPQDEEDDPLAGLETPVVPPPKSPTANGKKAAKLSKSKSSETPAISQSMYSTELQDILEALRRGIQQFNSGLHKTNVEIQSTTKLLDRTQDEYASLKQKISSFEEEQNQALEAEDFDKADRIQRTIDAINRTIGEVESRANTLEKQMEQLSKDRIKVFESHLGNIELVTVLLRDGSSQEVERAAELAEETRTRIEENRETLRQEDELLRVELEGIVSDLRAIEQEQQNINAKVDAGTVSLREEKTEWVSKIEIVDLEIEEIQKQLDAKLAEKESYLQGLRVVEDGIDAARSKYKRRLNDLETRLHTTTTKHMDAENRLKELANDLQGMKNQQVLAEEEATAMERAANEIASQVEVLEQWSRRLKSTIDCSHSGDATSDKSIRKLSDQAELLRQQIEIQTRNLQTLEHQNLGHTRKLMEVDSKLAILEDQKKQAVASRNFKEAGKVANEYKMLANEKEEVENLLSEKKQALSEVADAISEKRKDLDQCREELASLKEGIDEKELEKILARCHEMNEFRKLIVSLGTVNPGSLGHLLVHMVDSELDLDLEEARVLSIKIRGDESLVKFEKFPLEDQGKEVDHDASDISDDAEVECAEKTDETSPIQEEEDDEIIDIEALKSKIISLEEQVEIAVSEEDYERAANLDEEVARLREKLAKLPQESDVPHVVTPPTRSSESIPELEEKLRIAMEDEDFDLADILNNQIEALRNASEVDMKENALIGNIERDGELDSIIDVVEPNELSELENVDNEVLDVGTDAEDEQGDAMLSVQGDVVDEGSMYRPADLDAMSTTDYDNVKPREANDDEEYMGGDGCIDLEDDDTA